MTKSADQLIIDLANARAVVAGLSKRIGEALVLCESDALSKQTGVILTFPESHLVRLYRQTIEDDNPYSSGERRLSIDEKREALEWGMEEEYGVDYKCPHCLNAYDLIQERKQARVKAGRAMAAVTMRGKELMKGGV